MRNLCEQFITEQKANSLALRITLETPHLQVQQIKTHEEYKHHSFKMVKQTPWNQDKYYLQIFIIHCKENSL